MMGITLQDRMARLRQDTNVAGKGRCPDTVETTSLSLSSNLALEQAQDDADVVRNYTSAKDGLCNVRK